MNKDTYITYLSDKNYDLYYHWENHKKELEDKTDLLILYCQKELSIENAELKAKVYAYEKIIANSNFAPLLKESKSKEAKNK